MVGSSLAFFAESAYKPKHRFDARHNIFADSGFSTEDYRAISEAASVDFVQKLTGFCARKGYSYVTIPHADFVKYEKSDLNFREWYDEYRAERGLAPNPDTCIIAPRIKSSLSCQRKGRSDIGSQKETDAVTDYLAGMIVVMKKRPDSKNNRYSLQNLGHLMASIEVEPFTLGHKNYFYSPHDKTGFRAHKSLISAVIGPASEKYAGWEFPGEVKIEHESLMDIDKLTRSFIDIGRSVNKALMHFGLTSTPGDSANQNVVINKITGRIGRLEAASDRISKLLYDHVCANAGFNIFLGPDKRDAFAPKTIDEILAIARQETGHVPGGNSISRALYGITNLVCVSGRNPIWPKPDYT